LAALGYDGIDLTDAALNPVTHFKSQLGGELVLNLVVETRGTLRWRMVGTFDAAMRPSKGVVRRLVRPLWRRVAS